MTERLLAIHENQLAFELDDPPETHIYVASALTAIEPSDREEISRRCEIIDRTIIERSGTRGRPWRVHLPVLWSAPRPTDTRTPTEIYQTNRKHVRRAAGLILLGDHGGSLGAGQEFAWAVARRLPVFVIHPEGTPLSRQIGGTPAQMCIRQASSDSDLRDAVTRWVADWGAAVESRARSGTGELIIAFRAADRLRAALTASDDSLEAIAATAGMSVERINELFDPEALLDGSVSELVAISGALGLEAGEALNQHPPPELSPNQRRGLVTAAQEYEWTPPQILQVEARARLELARGGVRRLPLTAVQDWVSFARRYVFDDKPI